MLGQIADIENCLPQYELVRQCCATATVSVTKSNGMPRKPAINFSPPKRSPQPPSAFFKKMKTLTPALGYFFAVALAFTHFLTRLFGAFSQMPSRSLRRLPQPKRTSKPQQGGRTEPRAKKAPPKRTTSESEKKMLRRKFLRRCNGGGATPQNY